MIDKLSLVLVLMVTLTWGQGFKITYDEFTKAFTSNGFPKPTEQQFKNFNSSMGSMSSKQEAAMLLAQIQHESVGLQAPREIACRKTQCTDRYKHKACDVPGKNYFGRGYLQLTWCYNYRDASKAIFGDPNVLLNDPDRVAREEWLSWKTAFWYWDTRVHNRAGVQAGKFGDSTKAINGGECKPGNKRKEMRVKIYKNVRSAFGLPGAGDSSGC